MKTSALPRLLIISMMALPVFTLHAQPTDEALFDAFPWRNIGPANMGGRVVDIEAVEGDFAHVFLASASGGVWKSVNAGTTWEPIFDEYASASIGDIALFQPNPDIVWVGTGEANNRNSVSWGDGVYKSTDGGATFEHVGLAETHQIARIVTHPADPDVAYVCAIGHLWGYSGDRGLFKTTDSGASWTKLAGGLPDDGKTGCTDLVMHPTSPGALYSAFYHRLQIADSSRSVTHDVEFESATGIHRYRWNLLFDPEPLTEEQKQHVDALFQRLLQQFSFNSLRQAYQDFQQAQTPLERFQAIQLLRSGFFDAGLGDEYAIPTAGPGTYDLTLTVDGTDYTSTLTVRADPLGAER